MPINEIWKDIPGYEGAYQASTLGRIRSLPRNTTKGTTLKPYINKHNGYCYVSLSRQGKIKSVRVHCKVAETFLEKTAERSQVNHKDGDKTNNAVSNLEYCTQSENMLHAYQNELEGRYGVPTICLDTGVVYETLSAAARSMSPNAKGEMINRVCKGYRSHYRGMHFAYFEDYLNGTIPVYTGKVTRKGSKSLWR